MAPFPSRSTTATRLRAAALAWALAGPALAQFEALEAEQDRPVALVADEISFDEQARTVTARGDVEVYYGERTLTASEITYDSVADRISARGPLALRGPEGATLFADYAELDADLREGVIEGARALIGEGEGAGRLAAVEGRRVEGRYTSLSKAVFSPCEICAASPTPLWAIRARRIVHDAEEKVVHYEDPVFEVAGVPVAWLPYFSHPDPTVERKSGFLAPALGQSSNYGPYVKLPYFIALDPSSDVTLTPFVTGDDGPILEGEHRRLTARGGLAFAGSAGWLATASDGEREWRGHLFGGGAFSVGDLAPLGLSLGEGATAGFDVAVASDKGYLSRYGFSRDNRLENELYLFRYHEQGFYDLRALYFQTLREEEEQNTVPVALPDFSLRREVAAPAGFGDLGFTASGLSLARDDGRDVARLSLGADWSRREILPVGLAVRGFAEARLDGYAYADDPDYGEGTVLRFAPQAGIEAFYPLVATNEGTSHVIEPGAQLIVAPTGLNPDEIVDEDSLIVEFDETAIFDRNRFPGEDRIEDGTRINLGLRYARRSDDPLQLDAALGRVFRLTDSDVFSAGSGLSGDASDFVGAWSIGWGPWFTVANRFRLSDELAMNRNEILGRIDVGRVRIDAGYLLLESDATAGALEDRQEARLFAELDLDRNWTVGGLVRRDLENSEYVETAATLAFRNECAAVELFVGRDFVDREDSPPSTNVGLRVRLFGGADGRGRRSGVCAAAR